MLPSLFALLVGLRTYQHPYIYGNGISIGGSVWHYIHYKYFTSIYQPTNARIISHKIISHKIISHKIILKNFKTLRHVSILSDHHQGDLFLAKVMLQYSQFNSCLQTRNKDPWWWSDKIEICRSVFNFSKKIFMWNYILVDELKWFYKKNALCYNKIYKYFSF